MGSNKLDFGLNESNSRFNIDEKHFIFEMFNNAYPMAQINSIIPFSFVTSAVWDYTTNNKLTYFIGWWNVKVSAGQQCRFDFVSPTGTATNFIFTTNTGNFNFYGIFNRATMVNGVMTFLGNRISVDKIV